MESMKMILNKLYHLLIFSFFISVLLFGIALNIWLMIFSRKFRNVHTVFLYLNYSLIQGLEFKIRGEKSYLLKTIFKNPFNRKHLVPHFGCGLWAVEAWPGSSLRKGTWAHLGSPAASPGTSQPPFLLPFLPLFLLSSLPASLLYKAWCVWFQIN